VWPVVTLPIPEFVILSSAEVSPHWQIQQARWHSGDNRRFGVIGCVKGACPSALSGAAVHPTGARRSKCIIIITDDSWLPSP
jgi:hypothetical protein